MAHPAAEDQNHGRTVWTLFDLQTEQQQTYPTKDALLQAATAAGYHGPTDLQTVEEQYNASF